MAGSCSARSSRSGDGVLPDPHYRDRGSSDPGCRRLVARQQASGSRPLGRRVGGRLPPPDLSAACGHGGPRFTETGDSPSPPAQVPVPALLSDRHSTWGRRHPGVLEFSAPLTPGDLNQQPNSSLQRTRTRVMTCASTCTGARRSRTLEQRSPPGAMTTTTSGRIHLLAGYRPPSTPSKQVSGRLRRPPPCLLRPPGPTRHCTCVDLSHSSWYEDGEHVTLRFVGLRPPAMHSPRQPTAERWVR